MSDTTMHARCRACDCVQTVAIDADGKPIEPCWQCPSTDLVQFVQPAATQPAWVRRQLDEEAKATAAAAPAPAPTSTPNPQGAT